jgi:hypothetical protein
VTSRKLERATPPVWRPFSGLSLLYDPPGCNATSGVERLERVRADAVGDDRLLEGLARLAERAAGTLGAAGIEIALLPARTYHVTLCDGVNTANLDAVDTVARPAAAELLERLPDSLLWDDPLLDGLRTARALAEVRRWPVTVRATGLEVRGHALVVPLAPVDADAARALARHADARGELVDELGRLGVRAPAWHPHVTLGYLERRPAEGLPEGALPDPDAVVAATSGATLTLRTAAVYGFADMLTFWRLAVG